MSLRCDPPLALPADDDTASGNCLTLPRPTVTSGSSRSDGQLTYGLVARVALHQPGFGFRMEHDLPPGVELVETRPRATVVGEHLIWQLGRVDPGQQIRLEVVVRPLPGTILTPDDIATFAGTYSQNLCFEAPVVRSRLNARLSGPASTELGKSVDFILDVANIGTWEAEGVQASVTLPASFEHPDGPAFVFHLGSVKPGEFRRIAVPANAVACGAAIVRASVALPDDRLAVVEFPTEVIKPSEATSLPSSEEPSGADGW